MVTNLEQDLELSLGCRLGIATGLCLEGHYLRSLGWQKELSMATDSDQQKAH